MANFVRSLRTCARIRSLTTGTFNQVVKDRSTIRLSGAHSVQFGSHAVELALDRTAEAAVPTCAFRLSSKPFKHTVRRKFGQRKHPTEFPRDFHIGKLGSADAKSGPSGAKAPSWAALSVRLGVAPFPVLPVIDRREAHPAPFKARAQRYAFRSPDLKKGARIGAHKITDARKRKTEN